MCYHISITKDALKAEHRFSDTQDKYKVVEELKDQYHINGFHFPKVPVIASDQPNTWQAFNWGLIPSWTKSEADAAKIRAMTLNARADSLYEKPAYRYAAKSGQRCLIPADGIFEWHKLNKKSYPYYIHRKDKTIFCMAGSWEEWTDKQTGEIRKTFAMVTTEANPLMARIHNDGERMPVILHREYEMDWLNENLSKDDVLAMTDTYPDKEFVAHTISKLITTRGANTNVPEVQKPFTYAELEQSLF